MIRKCKNELTPVRGKEVSFSFYFYMYSVSGKRNVSINVFIYLALGSTVLFLAYINYILKNTWAFIMFLKQQARLCSSQETSVLIASLSSTTYVLKRITDASHNLANL